MIGGPGWVGMKNALDTPFNRKIHEEHAKAMAATGQTTPPKPYPYPVAYAAEEGGKWNVPFAVKFSDGRIYDCKLAIWRPVKVDPVEVWELMVSSEPLMSAATRASGDDLVKEIRELRAQLLDTEQRRRDEHIGKIAYRHRGDDDNDY